MLSVYFILFIGGYVASLLLTRSLDREDVFLLEQILKRAGVASEIIRSITGKISVGKFGKD